MSELPRVFIASSSEARDVAEAVVIRLTNDSDPVLWENAFDLSSFTLPSLAAKTREAQFAVFVFHRDDKLVIRGNEYSAVRDNVLFELGLFIGALGLDHCYVLCPKSSEGAYRLPTDLTGMTMAYYNDGADDMVEAVTASCAKVKISIKKAMAAAADAASQTAAEPSEGPLKILESDLWRARVDLDRMTEEAAAHQEAIKSMFFSVAKPATGREITDWETGAKNSYPGGQSISHQGRHNVYYVDRDVIVPAMYGADSVQVIVGPGVRLYGLNQRSHNRIYYMDGFRAYGV
jgi:hypothetical protein